MTLKQTPSQTVGPFFAYGLTPQQYNYDFPSVVDNRIEGDGERITLVGRVLDGKDNPVNDAVIEIWQADANGQYNAGDAMGFARHGTGTDPKHQFIFHTVKPGSVDNRQAPHICLIVFMRGLLNHQYTRVYFSDDSSLHAEDPVLSELPSGRRNTLIAQRRETPEGIVYELTIRMQGEQETVFFDV